MRQKLILLFVPFLLVSAGTVAGYTLLHWMLMGELDRLAVSEDFYDFWIPFFLPWIPLLIWVKPGVKLLRFGKRAKNPVFGFLLISSMAMAIPTIIAQVYLETATGKLTQLSRPDRISQQPPTKFYTISNYYIDTANRGVASISNVSGKFNSDLNLNLYVACPIYDESMAPPQPGGDSVNIQPDTAQRIDLGYGRVVYSFNRPSPKAWCCLRYHKTIGNGISQARKNRQFDLFYEESMDEFHGINFQSIVYFEKTGYDFKIGGFKKAAMNARTQVSDTSLNYILEPKFDDFADRNGYKLPWIAGSFVIGAAVWLIMIMIPPMDDAAAGQMNVDS